MVRRYRILYLVALLALSRFALAGGLPSGSSSIGFGIDLGECGGVVAGEEGTQVTLNGHLTLT